jgi:predicted ATPase
LAVAEVSYEAFSDGVFFVSLAPIRSPDLVATTIVRTLDLEERGQAPAELLMEHLQDKCMLLVLDNFEHLLPAGSLVAELLAARPMLKVLATSRATLRLSAEHEFGVAPLALPKLNNFPVLGADKGAPDSVTHDPADALAQNPAVNLFLQRAKAVKPEFALTQDNARGVAEICVRLDGLPLAIELAATRIKLLPPSALLTRLDHRLRLLTAGSQDLPPHQQTLRSTLDWSYMLLTEEEKLLFRRLSVFVGGCRLDTADAICNVDGRITMGVLDGIASLVDKSLLQQESQMDQEPRFMMLETMREYAFEQLVLSGEEDNMRRQHAFIFLQLAETADSHLRGAQQHVWDKRLDREHANLRAAMAWAEEQHEELIGLRLAAALAWYWMKRDYLHEGRHSIEAALQKSAPRLSTATQREVHAFVWSMFGAALLAFRQGDRSHVVSCLEQAMIFGQQYGDPLGAAHAAAVLAVTNRFDKGQEALALAEETVTVFRASRDRWGLAWSVFCLGEVTLAQEEYGRAKMSYEESLVLWQELGDSHAAAMVVGNLGQLAARTGDCVTARLQVQEALKVHCELGDRWFVATWLYRLAEVEWRAGEPLRAAQLFGAANVPLDSIGSHLGHWEQVEQERELAAMRTKLDDSTFNALWHEGRLLSLDQAVEYALGGTADYP